MRHWRICLVLAMLCVLPIRATSTEAYEDDEEGSKEEKEDLKEDGEAEAEAEAESEAEADPRTGDDAKEDEDSEHRKRSLEADEAAPRSFSSPPRPLECYVCSYKAETPLKSCLDPVKYRSHVAVCSAPGESCYTLVEMSNYRFESVVRGCRAACVTSLDMHCCNEDRCNTEEVAVRAPPEPPTNIKITPMSSKSDKPIPPTVLFFVTILLLLQTVAKVSFV